MDLSYVLALDHISLAPCHVPWISACCQWGCLPRQIDMVLTVGPLESSIISDPEGLTKYTSLCATGTLHISRAIFTVCNKLLGLLQPPASIKVALVFPSHFFVVVIFLECEILVMSSFSKYYPNGLYLRVVLAREET